MTLPVLPRSSMTGFASVQEKIGDSMYSLSLRSVNNRGFRLNVSLPSTPEIEDKLRTKLSERLTRGSADFRVDRIVGDTGDHDSAAFMQWREECRKNYLPEPSWSDWYSRLKLQSGRHSNVRMDIGEKEETGFFEAVERLLRVFDERRVEEGVAMAECMARNLEGIGGELDQVLTLLPEVQEKRIEKLREKLEKYSQLLEAEAREELSRELASLLEKYDVDEETDRLQNHLSCFADALHKKAREGKFLDFLCQEINREINTLGVKCQDARISQHCVEMKTLLEKIREQTQNLL